MPANHELSMNSPDFNFRALASLVLAILVFVFAVLALEKEITLTAVLWAAAFAVLVMVERLVRDIPGRSELVLFAGIGLLSTLFAAYLFGMNLQAKFWLIDDHQLVTYLGEDGRMSLSELPALLAQTEVGQAGEFPRFRPSYHTLRLIETWLWGGNARLWYLSRLVILTISTSLMWYVLARLVGFLPSLVAVAFIFTWPMWGDIFSRLGPGETYAVLGTAFLVFGSYLIVGQGEKPAAPSVGWLLVTSGMVLAMGSKENFMVFLPVVLLLLAVALKRKEARGMALAGSIVIFSYAGVITWAVLSAMSARGSDIYGRSAGTGDRLTIAVGGLLGSPAALVFLIGLFLLLIWLASYRLERLRSLRRETVLTLAVIVSLFSLYLSQYVFYAGEWPNANRYDFPGLFYLPLLVLTLSWYGLTVLRELNVISPSTSASLRSGAIVGAAFLVGAIGYGEVREIGLTNVHYTNVFDSHLTHVAETLNTDEDSALVIESHFVRDYETILSWVRFLRAKGVDNPVFLRIYEYSSETADSTLHYNLAAQLEAASSSGGLGLSPLTDLEEREGSCYSLQVSGYTETECEDLFPRPEE